MRLSGRLPLPNEAGRNTVDGDVWGNAIAEPGARRELCSLRTVTAKDARIEAQLTLRIYRSRVAEDGAVVSGKCCARHKDGTGQNH